MVLRQSPVCKERGCTGWCDTIYINGQEYLKCRTCGVMRKVSKRSIIPVKKYLK